MYRYLSAEGMHKKTAQSGNVAYPRLLPINKTRISVTVVPRPPFSPVCASVEYSAKSTQSTATSEFQTAQFVSPSPRGESGGRPTAQERALKAPRHFLTITKEDKGRS
jgi:hypothetical protein